MMLENWQVPAVVWMIWAQRGVLASLVWYLAWRLGELELAVDVEFQADLPLLLRVIPRLAVIPGLAVDDGDVLLGSVVDDFRELVPAQAVMLRDEVVRVQFIYWLLRIFLDDGLFCLI